MNEINLTLTDAHLMGLALALLYAFFGYALAYLNESDHTKFMRGFVWLFWPAYLLICALGWLVPVDDGDGGGDW